MKLRGLQKYLGQSLGYEVVELQEYRGLTGPGVVATPAFKDNLLSVRRVLRTGAARIETRRAAHEFDSAGDRARPDDPRKKPWVVGAVAALLVGCTVGFFGNWRAWNSARPDDKDLNLAVTTAKNTATSAQQMQRSFDDAKTELGKIRDIGDHLTAINDRRVMWPELLKAIGDCVPRDVPELNWSAEGKTPRQLTDQVTASKRIYLDSIDCEYYTKLEDWFADVKDKYQEGQPKPAAASADASAGATPAAPVAPPGGASGDATPTAGPAGEGWVIQLSGHHYHNTEAGNESAEYVRRTLMKNLEEKSVKLFDLGVAKNNPRVDAKAVTSVLTKQLGIGYPVLVRSVRLHDDEITLPGFEERAKPGGPPVALPGGAAAKAEAVTKINVPRYDFAVQFCWKETPFTKRREKAKTGEGEKAPSLAAGASIAPPNQAPRN